MGIRANLCGWNPAPDEVSAIIADADTPVYAIGDRERAALDTASTEARMESDRPPVILFDAMLPLHSTWKRGRQGIGDCVSFGFELAVALTVAAEIMWKRAPWLWLGEYATEAIYGGSRVEARGVQRGGYSDGSYGGAAAKWLTKWGALRRLDYSLRTGNKDHDLRTYSAERAKAWGNFGCGGSADAGKLDATAREFPVRNAFRSRKFIEAAASIESGYGVAVCSSRGFGARGADGFAPPSGTWMHCMAFTGVRYDKPGLLLTNSWGNSWGTSAPFYPANYPHIEVIKCSAWVRPEVVDYMLGQDDSFALTGVDGLERREIDWSTGWNIGGRK
jgi:hypothetical protein